MTMTNESHTQPNLQDLVREYYEVNALPDATLQQITTEPRPRLKTARQWVIAGAIAATLAVVALGVIVRELVPPAGFGEAALAAPQLVAVQIHADWCARSPEVAPIFTELLTKYGNEPVLFVTLDITDDVRREQAKLLSSNLGISQAFDEPFESGMIKLIDRKNHTVLAAITGREQAGELEVRIAEVLDTVLDGGREGGGG
jgi:thiol-disulfide isomerase/thioredoxin